MAEASLLLASDFVMMAALLLPIPPKPRTALWLIMLGSIATKWAGIGVSALG
jgi:hypothetical protein